MKKEKLFPRYLLAQLSSTSMFASHIKFIFSCERVFPDYKALRSILCYLPLLGMGKRNFVLNHSVTIWLSSVTLTLLAMTTTGGEADADR
jgi:hypothetical protein